MFTRLLIASLAIGITSNVTLACSCFGPQTFCETLNPQPPEFPEPQWWIPTDIILAVRVSDYEYSANVRVVQVFRGDLQPDQEIRVWGDCGLLCRHYVSGGTIGDTVLWAIQHCDLSGNGSCGTSFEEEGDYQLSVCGVYWLGYENGLVSGPLTTAGANQTMPVAEFQALVDGCLATSIAPAASHQRLEARDDGGTPVIALPGGSMVDLSVVDMQGRAVLRRLWNGAPLRLEVLPYGIFTVQARRGEEQWLVKVHAR